MQSVPQKQQPQESLDGVGAGDNDQSYRFGRIMPNQGGLSVGR